MKNRDETVIGLEVGTLGRWFRLIIGLYLSALVTVVPLLEHPVEASNTLALLANVALYALAILAVYTLAFYLLGERFLARTDPWIGTLVFLGPLVLVGGLGLGPAPFQVAIGLYYSVSSIFNFAMSYGGCEVIAIPSLIFRRRYTLYCPYNAVDVVEKAIFAGSPGETVFGLLSLGILVSVGGFFLLVEDQGVMRRFYDLNVHNAWALLLLIPIAFIAWRGRAELQHSDGELTGNARTYLLGGAVLAVLMIVFVIGINSLLLWPLAMLIGGGYGVYRLMARRSRPEPA